MQKTHTQNVTICRFLRAKNPFGGMEGGGNPWLMLDTANTTCWCVKTQGPVGPDNSYVEPERCTMGRGCFSAPE